MCSIYQGSTLTISAVVSSNCSEGCYRKAPVESCGSRVPSLSQEIFPIYKSESRSCTRLSTLRVEAMCGDGRIDDMDLLVQIIRLEM
jgi:hypothetical protein